MYKGALSSGNALILYVDARTVFCRPSNAEIGFIKLNKTTWYADDDGFMLEELDGLHEEARASHYSAMHSSIL